MNDDAEIMCPFCRKCVLHDYKGKDGFDDFDTSFCEHTVFAYSWGIDLVEHIQTGDSSTDTAIAALIEDGDSDTLGADVAKLVEKSLDGITNHVSQYVERGMGPRGGGPTYIVVFHNAAVKRHIKRLVKGKRK
jgi:hypothetical protein